MEEEKFRYMRVPAAKMELEKVTNGDAQSWWEPFWIITAMTFKRHQKKVDTTVTKFLNEESDDFKVPATKMASEKVACTVATFLNGDGFHFPTTKAEPG